MIAKLKKYNSRLVLLSLALAILMGILIPTWFQSLKFLGDLFINLLKLFALPLICSALVASLGGMSGGLANLKALSKKTISYMLISEVAAVAIALVLFNVLTPGVGSRPDLILNGQPYETTVHHGLDLTQFLLSIFPDNIFAALTNFELMPVVVFSIMFGIGCTLIGEKAKPLILLATGIRDVSTKCLNGVMLLAPLGIFALVGAGVAQSYLSGDLKANFVALCGFVAVLFLGLFLHALWQLIAVAMISKQNIWHILRQSVPVFSTAFGTSSSVATLPIAMATADQLKSKPFATRFMLPLCASINVGGMMMYEMAAVLFFAQMLGLDLSISQQLLLAMACILGGMAEGGIPETSMVSLVVVFRIVNIPLSAITILLPLDRIIDRVRTMVNIFGNMCGVIIVSQSLTLPDEVIEPVLENQPDGV
ncbi:MAG: dicarboxylate/amino acid:cation symporter [Rhabdochlamydiaceae bacterium]|nr:dicarboxylate/amino acid:cation symporter [Rhabdochlamydiaceae bacterium]